MTRHLARIHPLIVIIAIILFGMALVFPPKVFAQPGIPHSLDGRDDCLACHNSGQGGIPQIPSDHDGRTNDSCTACHQAALEGLPARDDAPGIPHEIEGREDCTLCHEVMGPSEPVTGVESTSPDIPDAISFVEPIDGANSCYNCHIGLPDQRSVPARNWLNSIHSERDVTCVNCHGGNPNAFVAEEAMSRAAGFIGKPNRTDIPALCASCHSDVNQMRQYDLQTDQYAQYLQSQHGMLLAQGDTAVATCFDCHDQHSTRHTNDPQSNVYPFNVPELCATCHADGDYMARYEIPTDQFDLYKESVHGHALLDNQDTRAPSCATCHGTHGAAPPGYEEVVNVCGSCHTATQDYFLDSPHNRSDDENAPLCVTCHGRYDVGVPSEAMFEGTEERHCGSCHEPGSAVGQTIVAMRDNLVAADVALVDAEESIERAARLGMIVSEEESLVAEARTKLITARAVQHTANLEDLLSETDVSVELSEQATAQAEAAIQESQSRRLAMIIAVLVITMVILSMILLRRELTREHFVD